MTPLALLATITFSIPRWSASPDSCGKELVGVPAGVQVLRAWTLKVPENRWEPYYGITYRAAGSADGRVYRWTIPTHRCGPGDSCGVRVATRDSVGNWNCSDAIVRWRNP